MKELEWPAWPQTSPDIEEATLRALRSSRWAISGMNRGAPSEERQFGEEFSRFIGSLYGVPVANGSSALVTALEAIGVKYGDEVLVPGVVWIACASAVARVGGVPVLVDIDEDTFCMSPAAAAAAITEKTRAILLVHLYSSIADLDAFMQLASEHQLHLIEDCSQAHGASWRGQRVGSFGIAGTFSFQNLKLLTCGEGGIVVTSDSDVYESAQQYRSDGRRWADGEIAIGNPDLEEIGTRQGHNFCLSEIASAILRAGLPVLERQNQLRAANVAIFEKAIEDLDGVAIVRSRDPRISEATFYHVPIRVEPSKFGGATGEAVGRAVSQEIGLYLEPVDPPLNTHPLYRPSLYNRFDDARRHDLVEALSRSDLPVSERLSRECFTIPHYAFLAQDENLHQLAESIAHVQRNLQAS